jgi:putative intracellular protease/amidase
MPRAQVAGLCSGVFVLAAAGLLDDRPATTHWAMAGVLAQMYPTIEVRAGWTLSPVQRSAGCPRGRDQIGVDLEHRGQDSAQVSRGPALT